MLYWFIIRSTSAVSSEQFTSVKTNENNNGTFINLTELLPDVIDELEKYANYVDEQQNQLKKGEI